MRRLVEKLWILFLARVLMSAGFSLSFPYLALYLNTQRGVPMHWVGTLLAFNIFAASLSQAAGGTLSDRFGRKPLMLVGLLSRAAIVYALYRAVDASAHFLVIAGLHLSSGVFGQLFDPAASAWVADQLPHHERVRAYGVLRTGGNAGWAVGPAIGGFLAGRAYAPLFLWTSLVYAVVSVLVLIGVRESADPVATRHFRLREELTALSDPRLRRLCLGTMLLGVTMSQLVAPLSLHAVRYAGLVERQVGFLFSINGGIVVLFQVAMVYLLRRRRLSTQLTAGALLYALGYGAVGFVRGFGPLALAMVVISMGEITGAPAEQALAANLAPVEQRGRYLGTAGLAQQAGWACGLFSAGWLLERWGMLRPSPYWMGIAVVACTAALVYGSMRQLVKVKEEGVELEEPVLLQPAV